MSFQRESFVCYVGNIECHGTIEEHTYARPDATGEFPYYKVGVIVAGIRSYSFDLLPHSFEKPYRYVVSALSRRSAIRDMVMESLSLSGLLREPLFPDLAFEAGLVACVKHYGDNPPRFAQATEHIGEL